MNYHRPQMTDPEWDEYSVSQKGEKWGNTFDLATDCRNGFSGGCSRATIAGSLLAELLLRWTSTLTSQCWSLPAIAEDKPSTAAVTEVTSRPCAFWFDSKSEVPGTCGETLSQRESLAFSTCSSISSKSLEKKKELGNQCWWNFYGFHPTR